ncbi:MAG: hypothetical protein F4Y98_02135, partial [Chloroflexi bacterium]|nr:hypothetical protein [Chloroflexota bacterium]
MNSRWMRNSFIYLIILVAVVLVVVMFFRPSSSARDISITDVVHAAQQGEVEKIVARGSNLTVHLRTQQEPLSSRIEESATIEEILRENGVPIGAAEGAVEVVVEGPSQFGNIFGLLFNFLPLIIFGAILI